MQPGMPSPPVESSVAGIVRELPDVSQARSALVTEWVGKIHVAKRFFKDDFERMREDQKFLRGDQWEDGDKDSYTANIIQRHVNQRVAALYAKNPKIVTRKRKTLDFVHWDGTTESLAAIQQAFDLAMQTGMQVPPEVMAKVTDIQQGIQRRQMLQKVSETLSIVYDYTLNQQIPPFKVQMKQLVRRVCATGVGYVKIGFQRVFERNPEDAERINGLTEQISHMESLLADKLDDEISDDSARLAELQSMLADYQNREEQVVREGLTFDFPSSTSIIIDPACRDLRTFLGARWIAEEYILPVSVAQEIYGIDFKGSCATTYSTGKGEAGAVKQALVAVANGGAATEKPKSEDSVCIWAVWDKTTGLTFTVADGYGDFVREPSQPDINLERFWPIFPLTFNQTEDDEALYPRSDVHLLKPMQREYNRSREGLRQHRFANRPKIAVAAGKLDEADEAKLSSHQPNAVIKLNGLAPNEDINKLLQPIKGAPIDAALYDTGPIFEDVLRVVGQSDASIGSAQGGVTATGDSIAEQNRTVAIASNVDDLDDMLNELSRSAGQVLLKELSRETVMKIAGPGAVWPELTAQEIADELLLEIEAGSSGRPNKAMEVANMERIAPLLLQIPGINPTWLVKQLVTRLDDRLDPTDAIAAGLPSIIAQNSMSKAAQTLGLNDPSAQGSQGADNQERQPGPANGSPSPSQAQPPSPGGMIQG